MAFGFVEPEAAQRDIGRQRCSAAKMADGFGEITAPFGDDGPRSCPT
jgi:hypothetical protein